MMIKKSVWRPMLRKGVGKNDGEDGDKEKKENGPASS